MPFAAGRDRTVGDYSDRLRYLGAYRGYKTEVLAGVSYQCPMLKLYGYETERKLRNGIDRAIRQMLAKGQK